MTTSDAATPPPSLEERIAKMVFQALQTELTALQAGLEEVQSGLDALASRVAYLERENRGPDHRPSINPPEKYDGASKQLADQFISQVEAAAEFERFRDERQKILWAQSYLTGSALAWSLVITTGSDDPTLNPRRFHWAEWLAALKAAFGLRDPAQDALNHIRVLEQGTKSITEYCTAFFELKGKLSAVHANSEYIKDRFWKGLSVEAMEALLHTDFATVEEARDILLRRESKLAYLAARRKEQWHESDAPKTTSATSTPTTPGTGVTVRSVPPPASKDPVAMDFDRVSRTVAKKCFKCGKTGHFVMECPLWKASVIAAVREAMNAETGWRMK